jgi:hypothetical protein
MDKSRRRSLVTGGYLGIAGAAGALTSTLSAAAPKAGQVTAQASRETAQAARASHTVTSLGINLSSTHYWDSERALVDLMKMAERWDTKDHRDKGFTFDADGYPLSLPDGKALTAILFTFPSEGEVIKEPQRFIKSGRYVVLYDGAEASWGNQARKNTNVFRVHAPGSVVSEARGRIVFSMDFTGEKYYQANIEVFSVNSAAPIRNIRIIPLDMEASFQKNPWTNEFLSLWSGVKAFRFMDTLGTNNSKQKEWNNRPRLTHQSWSEGVPFETLIDLCNRQNIDGWFCIPHLATDDYVERLAQLLKQTLKTKAYIEYSNEVWNWQFGQAQYALARYGELKLPKAAGGGIGGAMEFYSHRSKQIFSIFDKVYGADRPNRIVRVLGGQSAVGGLIEGMLKYEDVYKSADALATAPYFGVLPPGQPLPAKEIIEKWSLDDWFEKINSSGLPSHIKLINDNKALATKYGLPLIAYEGGQHLIGNPDQLDNDKITKALLAVNGDPRMEAVYAKYLNAWAEASGGLFCHFSSTGLWSKWGSWGVLQSPFQPLNSSPKYQALAKWANSRGQKMRLK